MPTSGDVLRSSGIPLLLNLLFYIAAAGLGASFTALFTANQYIVKGTFEPKYDPSYWIRFILGLIAGMVLAAILPINQKLSGGLQAMGRPLLAMLGGFSSSLLYEVLTRVSEAVESLVTGGKSEAVDAKVNEMNLKNAVDNIRNRSELAGEIIKTLQETASSTDPEEIRTKFNELQKKLSMTDSSIPPG